MKLKMRGAMINCFEQSSLIFWGAAFFEGIQAFAGTLPCVSVFEIWDMCGKAGIELGVWKGGLVTSFTGRIGMLWILGKR